MITPRCPVCGHALNDDGAEGWICSKRGGCGAEWHAETVQVLPSPTGMWGSTARNGRRVHAFVKWEVYDYETACGLAVAAVELPYDSEPDWNADVPSPPAPCPACRKAVALL